jgi:predicted DNA-binding transcriptional regulator AlpA
MSETQDRFLREAEVAAMTSLSRAQRWRLELRSEFPARIRLGRRTVVWSAREVDEWMHSRPRARYVPQGAFLGPRHNDEDAAPRATARRAERQSAKPRQATAL